MASDNGANGERAGALAPDHIVLDFDPATDHLDISGTMYSLDRALDILERAKRTLDVQWKLAQAQMARENMAATQRVLDLVRNSRGKR
jgi:hypothetical protein